MIDDNYNNDPNINKTNIDNENNMNRINDTELQAKKTNANIKCKVKGQNSIIDEIEDAKEKKSMDIITNEKINIINEDNKYESENNLKENEDNKISIEDDIVINTKKNNKVIINKYKGTSKDNDNSQSNKDNNTEGFKRDKTKDNKLEKVGEICNQLEKCESNIHLKEIVEQIEKLNLNDLLEKNLDENNKNKIELLNQIFDLIKENSENTNLDEETSINGEFLYNEWRKSFGVGYKQNDNFKLLVVYDDNITLKQIKDATIKLINNMKVKISGQDPGKFAKYIKTMILEDKFYEYNQQLTKN